MTLPNSVRLTSLAKPTTSQDLLAALKEFRQEAANVLAHLNSLGKECEQEQSRPPA